MRLRLKFRIKKNWYFIICKQIVAEILCETLSVFIKRVLLVNYSFLRRFIKSVFFLKIKWKQNIIWGTISCAISFGRCSSPSNKVSADHIQQLFHYYYSHLLKDLRGAIVGRLLICVDIFCVGYSVFGLRKRI